MNGTNRTSRKKKSKQQYRSGNRANQGQSLTTALSKKQQAILNAPVKLDDEVLVSIHGIGLCYRAPLRNCYDGSQSYRCKL